MNKNIKNTLILGFAFAAFCGTTFAAPPAGGGKTPYRTPTIQKAPAAKCGQQATHAAKPADRGKPAVNHARAPEPAHHEHAVTHRQPTAPRHNTPQPPRHERHHDHHERDGWITLGAAALGGIIGGILGN